MFYSLGILKRCESVKLSLPVRTARAFIINFSGSNLEFMIMASLFMASLFCFFLVLFTNIGARCTHLGLLKGRRPLSSCYLGISLPRFYGLAAWAELFKAGLRQPRVSARFELRFERLKSSSVLIVLVYKLMIGSSKNNRENYPRKCF